MTNNNQDVAAELVALETKRSAAISTKDWATVESLCAADLTHTHSSGRTEDRNTYIKGLMERPRGIERRNLAVRVYGDAAVMTGLQFNSPEGAAVDPNPQALQVMQVWIKGAHGWQVTASQTTRIK